MMLTLREQLKEMEERLGKDDPAVQMLRNQVIADESGKTFTELYVSRAPKSPVLSTRLVEVTPAALDNHRPSSVLVDGELRLAFLNVVAGLTSKRRNKRFYSSVATLINGLDESVITDVGERIGDGLPHDYLRMQICTKAMADMLGLNYDELAEVSETEKIKFARERLRSLQSDTDADICPGFWLLPLTDGEKTIFLGFSVAGYSFSGVVWTELGVFLSEVDFVRHICCGLDMLFENKLCVNGQPVDLNEISDSTLLHTVWGE